MTGRSNAASGRSEFIFTYNYQGNFGSDQPTLNGQAISLGETVKLLGGSINVLYSPTEGMQLLTDDGIEIPRLNVEQSKAIRASSPYYYVRFVMPTQNVSANFV